MKGRLEVRRSTFQDFGHFGSFLAFLTDDLSPFLIKFWPFWAILVDFGSVGGPGRSGEMAEGPGKGQLRAWQGLGRGQGPRSGSDFGRFGTFLGPCPESENFDQGSGTSQKGGSMPGDFGQNLDGRVILGSKI